MASETRWGSQACSRRRSSKQTTLVKLMSGCTGAIADDHFPCHHQRAGPPSAARVNATRLYLLSTGGIMGDVSGTAWINGVYMPAKDATISVFDSGFVGGVSVFDTLACWQGKL